MKKWKIKWPALLFLLPGMFLSQSYQWQWAKQAGGYTGSVDSGFNYVNDESIRDIAVDSQNNTYYLATVYSGNQNLNGAPVTNYDQRDLLLFSTDCQGNIRWSRTIGGTGSDENAWNIELDNNGGVYLMANLFNQAYENSAGVPVHFDDSQAMPLIQTYDQNTVDPGLKTGYLLKYNTADGNLVWSKPLQGDVTAALRQCDSQMMYMDSSKNIHAILGFCAGTHLNGLITVPSSYTNAYQYYLVTFNYANGTMTPATATVLPMTGFVSAGMINGHVNMMYDESLSRYYMAGKRRAGSFSALIDFSFNNIPVTREAFLIAFDRTGGTITEAWRKEINTGEGPSSIDDEIHSIIKDANSSDIYISGRYYSDTATPVTFGNYTFPVVSYTVQRPFVMKLSASGAVQWAKIPDGMNNVTNQGYRFMKGMIVQNGNEIGFAHGSWGSIWGNYSLVRPSGDRADPILVRLNKDTGAVNGMGEIMSNYGVIDEFTAIAVDRDGNYALGGFFHQQLFTGANDNVPTMDINVSAGKSQNFITKYAKSACSGLSVEETAAQAGLSLYPNPVQEILTIRSKNNLEWYEMYSSAGQLLRKGNLQSAKAEISMNDYSTGVYYIKVKTDKAVVTEKVIKK